MVWHGAAVLAYLAAVTAWLYVVAANSDDYGGSPGRAWVVLGALVLGIIVVAGILVILTTAFRSFKDAALIMVNLPLALSDGNHQDHGRPPRLRVFIRRALLARQFLATFSDSSRPAIGIRHSRPSNHVT